ncbi:hypothetical protein EJ02DRAFT_509283 [Clathrospora elynae]|uniref:Uncharacterized protein n=1 Tax=Clathrospora elynae TaxID=706981 RepID=A0A6A5SY48_9PLEO|nr:hypothetical protein EJ02DRAFT_509283 [Clathrospora elynae]
MFNSAPVDRVQNSVASEALGPGTADNLHDAVVIELGDKPDESRLRTCLGEVDAAARYPELQLLQYTLLFTRMSKRRLALPQAPLKFLRRLQKDARPTLFFVRALYFAENEARPRFYWQNVTYLETGKYKAELPAVLADPTEFRGHTGFNTGDMLHRQLNKTIRLGFRMRDLGQGRYEPYGPPPKSFSKIGSELAENTAGLTVAIGIRAGCGDVRERPTNLDLVDFRHVVDYLRHNYDRIAGVASASRAGGNFEGRLRRRSGSLSTPGIRANGSRCWYVCLCLRKVTSQREEAWSAVYSWGIERSLEMEKAALQRVVCSPQFRVRLANSRLLPNASVYLWYGGKV